MSKYLFTFEEANPTYVDGTKDVLNWGKLRMIHAFIAATLALRDGAPKLEAGNAAEMHLLLYLNLVCADTLDSSAAYARSLELEPREDT